MKSNLELKEDIRAAILKLLRPCLVYMKLLGLAPYSLELNITSTSLLYCITLSLLTVFSIFFHFILDVKFLSVKGFELIPAIILYTYNIVLSTYICYDLVQNLRKQKKSKKLLLVKLVHIDYLISTQLHLPLFSSNAKIAHSVLYLTVGNIATYTCLALVNYSLFHIAIPLKLVTCTYLVTLFLPVANINADLILLLSKMNLIRQRFILLNDLVRSVAKLNGDSGTDSIMIRENSDDDDVTDATHNRTRPGATNNVTRYGAGSKRFRDVVRRVTAAGMSRKSELWDSNMRGRGEQVSGFLNPNKRCEVDFSIVRQNDMRVNKTEVDHSNVMARRAMFARAGDDTGLAYGTRIVNSVDLDRENKNASLSRPVQVLHIQPSDDLGCSNDSSFSRDMDVPFYFNERDYIVGGVNHYNIDSELLGSRTLRRLRARNKHIGMEVNDSGGSRMMSGGEMESFIYSRMSEERKKDVQRNILSALFNVVKIHFDICELSRGLNSRYSHQILAILCLHFLSLCSTIYSSIAVGIAASKSGFGWREVKMVAYFAVLLMSQVFWIMLITRTSYHTMEESKQTKVLIHNFLIEETFPEIEQELDFLVRHLEKHKIQFTANGFFTVDYKIFCMMVGTAATYWIVLVQLDL